MQAAQEGRRRRRSHTVGLEQLQGSTWNTAAQQATFDQFDEQSLNEQPELQDTDQQQQQQMWPGAGKRAGGREENGMPTTGVLQQQQLQQQKKTPSSVSLDERLGRLPTRPMEEVELDAFLMAATKKPTSSTSPSYQFQEEQRIFAQRQQRRQQRESRQPLFAHQRGSTDDGSSTSRDRGRDESSGSRPPKQSVL